MLIHFLLSTAFAVLDFDYPFKCNDFVCNVHPLNDISKCGILAIKVWGSSYHDEELGASRVWISASGHAEDAALVERVVKFGIDLVARIAGSRHATCAITGIWATALDHKARNDPVELESIVEALGSEFLEICDVIGSLIRQKSNYDLALVGLHDGNFFAGLWCWHSLYCTSARGASERSGRSRRSERSGITILSR